MFLCEDTEASVGWPVMAELKALPKNPVRLSLFMRAVSLQIAEDMPAACTRFNNGAPQLSKAERRKGALVAQVSELIENTRVSRRSAMLEYIPLTDERWRNEDLNMTLSLWLLGCQCNLLVQYLSEDKRSTKTGADFAAATRVKDLVMYRTVRIMEYPLSAVRMVVLRIVKMWNHLPVLSDEFIEYLRLVRLRLSELQCNAFDRSSHTLDYPPWTKHINDQYARPTLDMSRQVNTEKLMCLSFYDDDEFALTVVHYVFIFFILFFF